MILLYYWLLAVQLIRSVPSSGILMMMMTTILLMIEMLVPSTASTIATSRLSLTLTDD